MYRSTAPSPNKYGTLLHKLRKALLC